MIYYIILILSLFLSCLNGMENQPELTTSYETNSVPPLSFYAITAFLSKNNEIKSTYVNPIKDGIIYYNYLILLHAFHDTEKPLSSLAAHYMMYSLWLRNNVIEIPEKLLDIPFFYIVNELKSKNVGEILNTTEDKNFIKILLEFYDKNSREQLLLKSIKFNSANKTKLAKEILATNITIDCQDFEGKTPLQCLMMCPDITLLKLLLENKASLIHVNKLNKDVFHYAYGYADEYHDEKKRRIVISMLEKEKARREESELITDTKCLVM